MEYTAALFLLLFGGDIPPPQNHTAYKCNDKQAHINQKLILDCPNNEDSALLGAFISRLSRT